MSYYDKAHRVHEFITSLLPPGYQSRLRVESEDSSFVRFNKGAIRQPGSVRQSYVSIEIHSDKRHTNTTLSLTDEDDFNRAIIKPLIEEQVILIEQLEPDPHFIEDAPTASLNDSRGITTGQGDQAIRDILDQVHGLDVVGIYAEGQIARTYLDSSGSSLHYQTSRSHFDFSVYAQLDKAVKCSISGAKWDRELFNTKVSEARGRLPFLVKEPYAPKPGAYRSYLAPSAMRSILSLVSRSSFSEKAHQTGLSPLKRLKQGRNTLNEAVSLAESPKYLEGCQFHNNGFVAPDETILLKNGVFENTLISPRSGQEFGLSHNGSPPGEHPEYLRMSPGTLSQADILSSLGTGIYISDLWYLNFSDPQICRMTGMTRFASFWVEDGKIVAPLSVMRFDDSLYEILGSKLVSLTEDAELFHEAHTYTSRSLSAMSVPGALVEGLTFTL